MSIEELKELQAKIIKKNKTIKIIGIVIFITIIFLSSSVFASKEPMLIGMTIFFEAVFSFIIIGIIRTIASGKDIKSFSKEFKNIFVLRSLKNIFEDVTYNPEKGFSESFIRSVGMISTGDSYESNDYISGKYRNISFEQSDVHIQEEHESTDSEGNTTTTWVTIFEGRIMIFDFNKQFKANVQVASRYFGANVLPWSKKFTKVNMEDMEFNKTFNVYAESEHDAFYILTPHFMEKLKNIKKTLNCGIMFCFVDNKLHIAVDNSKDSFEPVDEQKIEEEITKDIKFITNFVDELNLENDLFRREV